jgi:uncharacterized protein YqeY
MTTLYEQIEQDLVTARKQRDHTALDALGMLKSEVVNAGKEPGVSGSTDDSLVMRVLRREVKRREEAAQAFATGGRTDSARKEEAEATILRAYLPAQISEEELEGEVRAVIAEVGASGPRDMGAVMKAAGRRLADRAEPGQIAAVARRLLAG